MFAPVGVPESLLMVQLAADRFGGNANAASNALTPLGEVGHGRHDTACKCCGMRVCENRVRSVQAALAQPALTFVPLAPGWTHHRGGSFTHLSNAVVWPVDDGSWNYCGPCSHEELEHARARDGHAPTRDEAMALALGWAKDPLYPGGWSCAVDNLIRQVAVPKRGGDWDAYRIVDGATSAARRGTLPHAIAWCRGDDKADAAKAQPSAEPKPSAEPSALADGTLPDGWETYCGDYRTKWFDGPLIRWQAGRYHVWRDPRPSQRTAMVDSLDVAMLVALGCDVVVTSREFEASWTEKRGEHEKRVTARANGPKAVRLLIEELTAKRFASAV
ncbi:MAG TPA: hypothetical protein VHM19_23195 [Polyangiales bacterium]|nr:hypothetical protein [Polyangiales bacterium]